MRDTSKYRGIIPAFYVCYDDEGAISPERVEELTRYMARRGAKGLYVGGSSGEYIYQSVSERKLVLGRVVRTAEGKLIIITHMGCNNMADSMELATHVQSLGAGTIASIPPIYFHPPKYAIVEYWNDISLAALDTDFVIYNIPQPVGVVLTMPLSHEMLKNPRAVAAKNSSMPIQDIQTFKMDGSEGFVVFNGPDKQLVSGLAMDADSGVDGTYGVVSELYIKIMELVEAGDIPKAGDTQNVVGGIIYKMCPCRGNSYAVMKGILSIRKGLKLGSMGKPIPGLMDSDMPCVKECADMIGETIEKCR